MRNYPQIEKEMQNMADRKAYICKIFPWHSTGVEIGVFLGQFSEKILEIAKPRKLYLVDPWGEDTSFPPEVEKERRTRKQMDDLARRVIAKFGKKKNVRICRSTSINFFESLPQEIKFDFIYIDGNHSYESVSLDLENSWKFLYPGGVIVADDHNINIPYWGEPITRAVADFCREKNVKSNLCPHNQCVIRKP